MAICTPPRLSEEIFKQLKPLPDPTPGIDNHYLSFSHVFGQNTSEEHRPSLNLKKPKKTLPFSASIQHVKNVDMMMFCEECGMCVFCIVKLNLKTTAYSTRVIAQHLVLYMWLLITRHWTSRALFRSICAEYQLL